MKTHIKGIFIFFICAAIAASNAFADSKMIKVEGGSLPESSQLQNKSVKSFELGKYEVTWDEWQKVRDWSVSKGYNLAGVGDTYPIGSGNNFPVTNVSWYDVVKWCNAKSEMEGKTPVYTTDGTIYKTGQVAPTVSKSANGYRLPSESEWEWAARGGVRGASNSYTFSGSNDANAVAWTAENSLGESKAVGTKLPNELGLYDMSGNVFEWCEADERISALRNSQDAAAPTRGGSWSHYALFGSDNNNIEAGRDNRMPSFAQLSFIGFRLASSSEN